MSCNGIPYTSVFSLDNAVQLKLAYARHKKSPIKEIRCAHMKSLSVHLYGASAISVPEPFPTLRCDALRYLEIVHFHHVIPNLQSTLDDVPRLRTLIVDDLGEWRIAQVKHACLRVLRFRRSEGLHLILHMDCLETVDLGRTRLLNAIILK